MSLVRKVREEGWLCCIHFLWNMTSLQYSLDWPSWILAQNRERMQYHSRPQRLISPSAQQGLEIRQDQVQRLCFSPSPPACSAPLSSSVPPAPCQNRQLSAP